MQIILITNALFTVLNSSGLTILAAHSRKMRKREKTKKKIQPYLFLLSLLFLVTRTDNEAWAPSFTYTGLHCTAKTAADICPSDHRFCHLETLCPESVFTHLCSLTKHPGTFGNRVHLCSLLASGGNHTLIYIDYTLRTALNIMQN